MSAAEGTLGCPIGELCEPGCTEEHDSADAVATVDTAAAIGTATTGDTAGPVDAAGANGTAGAVGAAATGGAAAALATDLDLAAAFAFRTAVRFAVIPGALRDFPVGFVTGFTWASRGFGAKGAGGASMTLYC